MTDRHASAHWEGPGKTGKGRISMQSGVLTDTPYGFNTRFENESGTNPEELVAAAHSGCFAMALAVELEKAGYTARTLDVRSVVTLKPDGESFKVTKSALTLNAVVPNIDEAKFNEIAAGAKANCPISKLLTAEITLEATFSPG